jgi:hypothetical protein
MKIEGQKRALLTAYDMYTAAIFEETGIPVLLVGDSASNNVYGNESTLQPFAGSNQLWITSEGLQRTWPRGFPQQARNVRHHHRQQRPSDLVTKLP